MTLLGCYKPTVNESETIIEAQPFCLVRSRSEAKESRAFGFQVSGRAHIERS